MNWSKPVSKLSLKTDSGPIRSVIVGDFKADLIVSDELIIELKAVSGIIVEHEVQLVNYLAATERTSDCSSTLADEALSSKRNSAKRKLRTCRSTNPV